MDLLFNNRYGCTCPLYTNKPKQFHCAIGSFNESAKFMFKLTHEGNENIDFIIEHKLNQINIFQNRFLQ